MSVDPFFISPLKFYAWDRFHAYRLHLSSPKLCSMAFLLALFRSAQNVAAINLIALVRFSYIHLYGHRLSSLSEIPFFLNSVVIVIASWFGSYSLFIFCWFFHSSFHNSYNSLSLHRFLEIILLILSVFVPYHAHLNPIR